MDAEPNRRRGGGKHWWDKQVSRDGREKDTGRRRGKERRSYRGRVKLASLPSGLAASQWHLTGKESYAPNRTHRGHRCVCKCVCMSEREKKMTDIDSEASRKKMSMCELEQSSVGSVGKLVTTGQTDRLGWI